MEFRSLYYFLVVVREGNITRASELLHMTQPTLSRILMKLEEDMRTQLIIRGKRKIELTESGMILKRRAEEILNLVDETKKELSGDEILDGMITIGAAECMASHLFLPEALHSFAIQNPNVTYDLYSGNADLIKERMQQRKLELGILLEPVDILQYDFIRLPQKEKWGLLVNKESSLASQKYITPKDLCGIPLINTKRFILQNEIASWSKGYYNQLHFIATYNLLSNAISLVERGMGSVITIKGAYYHHTSKKVKFIPFFPILTTGAVIAWKKNQILSKASSRFIEYIKCLL